MASDRPDQEQRVDPLRDETRWRAVREKLGLPETVSLQTLAAAFTHTSFAREAGLGPSVANQRLEFLGDAVLDLILVEHLYRAYPTAPEGNLTKMKAYAVRASTLARVARQLGLGEHMLLGKGEEDTGGRGKTSLLEDCMEAVVGAVYLSTDLETTRDFVMTVFAPVLESMTSSEQIHDHKTELQELLQERTKQTPSYVTVDTLGPAHDRTFVVEVRFRGMTIGSGEGSSKQAAQQQAAREALDNRDGWLSDLPA
ncbi:MAG: ribonuclease III [Armatimonadetes bacterium]|nr:ribonuclease III [Armatimonadota bacterium]MDI9587159.1 ribonuclease III [Acidobacteriota bacterium]